MSEEPQKPASGPESDDARSGDDSARPGRAGARDLPLVGLLQAVDRGLGLAEQVALVGLLLGLIGVASAQAVATKLGVSWGWSFEFIRYAVFFIAMTGAALSAHTEQLIAMDFVTRMLRAPARARLRILLRVFTLGVCLLLVIGGKALSEAAASETLYHVIPPDLGLLALPIGAGLIAFHVLVHMVVDILYMANGLVPPEPEAPAAH